MDRKRQQAKQTLSKVMSPKHWRIVRFRVAISLLCGIAMCIVICVVVAPFIALLWHTERLENGGIEHCANSARKLGQLGFKSSVVVLQERVRVLLRALYGKSLMSTPPSAEQECLDASISALVQLDACSVDIISGLDEDTARLCLQYIGRKVQNGAESLMRECLKDSRASVRSVAATQICYGGPFDSGTWQVMDTMARSDPELHVRAQAVHDLGDSAFPSRYLVPLFYSLHRDANVELRIEAIRGLGNCLSSTDITSDELKLIFDALIGGLSDDPDVFTQAVYALGSSGNKVAAVAIATRIEDPAWEGKRNDLCEALVRLGDYKIELMVDACRQVCKENGQLHALRRWLIKVEPERLDLVRRLLGNDATCMDG